MSVNMDYSPNLLCRLCLLDGSGNVSIFSNYNDSRSGFLAHKIMQIANVQMYEGDGLPPLICRSCLSKVEAFFQFKVQVEKSDFYLRQQVCSFQGDVLTSTTVDKTSENVKNEPLSAIKNGVYLSDSSWTDGVQSFPGLQSCETLTSEPVSVDPPPEVNVVLSEEPHPTFVNLTEETSQEDKALLDLTQQEGKCQKESSRISVNYTEELIEKNVPDKSNYLNTVFHVNSFFSRTDGLALGNQNEKDNELYNLDKKESEGIENNNSCTEETNIDENYENEENKEDEEIGDDCDNVDSFKSDETPSGSKNEKITYCEQCDKHFEKPISLKKHQSVHPKESFNCTFCNKSFKHSWNFQSHIRSHTGERPFVCSICSKTFTDKSALNAHTRIAHFTEKTHKCTFCGKAFKLKKQLDRHERIHTGHQYHRCEICGKLFTQKSNLMKHSVLHSGEKPYVCPVCEKPFAQKDNLNIHIIRHHSQQTPVICDVCGKVFKNKMTLVGHKKSKHSENIKQIICEVCGKFFPDRSCLNSHKWVHNSGVPVQCDICGKSYPHGRALRVHKRIVHAEVRKYCCDVCGIGFKTSQTLKHHKVVHTGERAFSCEECGRSFGQKTALKTHQRIHSGVEPYSCPRCGESFKWKQTCDKHILKCTGKPRQAVIDYRMITEDYESVARLNDLTPDT
ncbi:zinc finger protein ZFP2-like [Macrosteles quadrilineatus]|uniref:zinc finger protein ZFP2-like n=1 Tax=Macrosteles quadrilineatus TaxID=74068 RepID=UPI0023E292F5|nr:zinc finger protein ZFP2-like [Macrosteles quadrilineatus]